MLTPESRRAGRINEVALDRAIALHRKAQRPADPGDLKRAIARLHALTAKPNQAGADARLQAAAIFERIASEPGDLALAALEDLGDSSKWFPAWAEILENINFYKCARQANLRDLEALRKPKKTKAKERADPAYVAAKMKQLRELIG